MNDLLIIFNSIDKLVVHRIGIAMYKINNGLFPSVLMTMTMTMTITMTIKLFS